MHVRESAECGSYGIGMSVQPADRRGAACALAAACAAYAIALTLAGANRYFSYHSGADLGEFVQTIATPFSGFGDTPEGGSHFLHHFSPLLYLCSPLLLMLHSPVALVAIQAVAGALVAPAIFLLVRKRAGPAWRCSRRSSRCCIRRSSA